MDNPYLQLTEDFNRDGLRVLLSSGQAVVVHRLAIMSKDGDWIVREEAREWAAAWPDVQRQIEGLPLPEAHRLMVARAEGILPFSPPPEVVP